MPDTRNFQLPTKFRFFVDGLKNVNFTCQAVSLPGVSLGSAETENPFVRLKMPGDKLIFSPLNVTFIVQEGLINYMEVFEWMEALGFPESHSQYRNIPRIKKNLVRVSDKTLEYSDGTLVFLDSSNNPSYGFRFTDLFPVQLSDINLDTKDQTGDPIIATATFNYRSFELIK